MNTTKISQILKQTTIQQIQGNLIRFIGDNIEGKCAMGVLACEDGNEKHKLSKTEQSASITHSILGEYDIPEDIRESVPTIRHEWGQDSLPQDEKDVVIELENTYNLTYQIMALNDGLGLNFKQIAEFLEVTYDL